MILYYSSTGNSKHIAKLLQKQLNDSIFDIGKNYDSITTFNLKDNETLYLVTFNCYWGVPDKVVSFLKRNKFNTVKRFIAIITCGGYLGSADAFLEKICKDINLPKPEVYELIMVTNYIVFHVVPSKKEQEKLLNNADNELNNILSGNSKVYKSPWHIRMLGPLLHKIYDFYKTTKYFTVNDNCISCNICKNNCPVKAIEIVNNKPKWILDKCDHCLRCIHHCPKQAIDYGNKTIYKDRYVYKEK